MESVKEQIHQLVGAGDYETAGELLRKNLHTEIPVLKCDPEYCVLAATVYMENGFNDAAVDFMALGLMTDSRNYELYLVLGEYYAQTNICQALICFEQALFYCDNNDDRQIINSYIENVMKQGAFINPVSIVIVTNNDREYISGCLESIKRTIPGKLFEIIVVDNGSIDGTAEFLDRLDGTKICLNEGDDGYIRACNFGIKMSGPDNDIFLLDPGTILPDNAFFYLFLGLYSDTKIGAIGATTNEFIHEQKLQLDISDLDFALEQAKMVNSPMANPLEKSIYISDYAMLIRRECLDKVGMFDEDYSPFGLEDNDLCVRICMAGYPVILCVNSLILSRSNKLGKIADMESFLVKNKDVFRKKWGYNADYSNVARISLVDLIDAGQEDSIEVLELGCALGNTLNHIKRKFPNSAVYGVEYDAAVARVAGSVTDVIQGDVEIMEIPYNLEQFDYIICADVLEHLRDPEGTLRRFMPYLKEKGKYIISLPNVRHYAVLAMLALWGRFDYSDSGILDSTHVRFFTRDTAIEMIERTGLKVQRIERNINGQDTEVEFIEKLKSVFEVVDSEELKVFQYYFVAEKN